MRLPLENRYPRKDNVMIVSVSDRAGIIEIQ
ncbi:hypothetical protein SAMN05444123_101367 [Rhodopseudomonas pseudopalustris]|uniref:Uncharacterized protein n=1 Tax=Rhodopseudomonas pseudopalustris TaxID=1513892 RepID=A0A1H8M502_9BRAD|nr:hypothetical protein SAMN05444123_101367 [Rhodopseudomonas pseudopalustris]